MLIEIEALDTLIFRDGKPFDKDSDSWTNSFVLPTPTTIYGALRATYFAQNPKEIEKANSKDDPTKELKIKNIFYKNRHLLFPMPKDCVIERSNNEEKVKILSLQENKYTSSPLEKILSLKNSNGDIENIDKLFLGDLNFEDYLKGDDEFVLEKDEFFDFEDKIGIGLNKQTKTAQEGLLYRINFLRYYFNICVEFDGIKIDTKGLMKLGGEAKGAKYQEIQEDNIPKIDSLSSNIFKLYFLTPSYFEQGWLPSWINKKSLEGKIFGFKIKLLACAVGKYQLIGGYDIKENKPKPMNRFIPAGSVYYFEILEGNKESVIDTLHLKAISDLEDFKNQGYGIVIVGDVK